MSQVERHFIDTIKIFRKSETQDKFGGTESEQELVCSELPARIYAKLGLLRTTEAGKEYRPTHRMMVAASVEVQADDKVQDQNGKRYQVISVNPLRIESKNSHVQCELIEVAG